MKTVEAGCVFAQTDPTTHAQAPTLLPAAFCLAIAAEVWIRSASRSLLLEYPTLRLCTMPFISADCHLPLLIVRPVYFGRMGRPEAVSSALIAARQWSGADRVRRWVSTRMRCSCRRRWYQCYV